MVWSDAIGQTVSLEFVMTSIAAISDMSQMLANHHAQVHIYIHESIQVTATQYQHMQ